MKKKVLGIAVVVTFAIVATIGFMTTQKGGSDSKMFSNVEALAAGEGSVTITCCAGFFGKSPSDATKEGPEITCKVEW